ncbi:unnamed protein product [Lymnaea stagnalis]|uniref:EGF-like domain-containing protein n=1 Tax=Lymnaea stagnalis TaxID=6523 RepID=A0AAV2HE70_LYMST
MHTSSRMRLLIIVIIGLKYSPSNAQGTCDPLAKQCINGMCQVQSTRQFGCTCNQHYMRDPSNPLVCHPIPPCNLIQGAQQCVNGQCQMLPSGQYGCLCNPGFQVSSTDPNYCEDMNECLMPITGCAPNACTDLVGDYVCTSCAPGFALNQFSKCEVQNQNVPNQAGGFGGGNPFMWAMMMGDFF